MNAIFTDIAVDQAGTIEQRQALQALREVVAACEADDADFAGRINASKTRGGEAPTQLSPAKRRQLAAFEPDRIALDEDMAHQFHALHSGIGNQLPITRKQLKFYHPDDLSIDTDRFDKLEAMATALAQFLQNFPGETEPGELG